MVGIRQYAGFALIDFSASFTLSVILILAVGKGHSDSAWSLVGLCLLIQGWQVLIRALFLNYYIALKLAEKISQKISCNALTLPAVMFFLAGLALLELIFIFGVEAFFDVKKYPISIFTASALVGMLFVSFRMTLLNKQKQAATDHV